MMIEVNLKDAQDVVHAAAVLMAHSINHNKQTVTVIKSDPKTYSNMNAIKTKKNLVSFAVWYWPDAVAYQNRENGTHPYSLMHPTTKAEQFVFELTSDYDGLTLSGAIDKYLTDVLVPEINAL